MQEGRREGEDNTRVVLRTLYYSTVPTTYHHCTAAGTANIHPYTQSTYILSFSELRTRVTTYYRYLLGTATTRYERERGQITKAVQSFMYQIPHESRYSVPREGH